MSSLTDLISNNYYADPTLGPFGSLPPNLAYNVNKLKVKIYENDFNPNWYPSTKVIRDYLLKKCWGGAYQSRSKTWVIGHDGIPLSEDSIQIDHIFDWKYIKEKLLYQYSGVNAIHYSRIQLTPFPNHDGKMIKGIDYVDDPGALVLYGEDAIYRYTNIAAIKYYHVLENLRPLSGSINSRRNNINVTDAELGIIPINRINIDLMEKLAELVAAAEEYIKQAATHVSDIEDEEERLRHSDYYIDDVQTLIDSMLNENRSKFIF